MPFVCKLLGQCVFWAALGVGIKPQWKDQDDIMYASINMNGLVCLLGAVLFVGISEQAAINKYNQEVFSKVHDAGVEAQKSIELGKIDTRAEQRFLSEQANDFHYYISKAAHILNIAVLGGSLEGALHERLSEVSHELTEGAIAVIRAVDEGQAGPLKDKLSSTVANAAKSVVALSKFASDVDKIEGLKLVEVVINNANHELLRGFFHILARYHVFGKTKEEIEHRLTENGLKASSLIGKVTGDAEHVAHVLKGPARNLVELIDIALIKLDDLVYDEETVKNAGEIRQIYKELAKIYPEAVNLKIRFRYQPDDAKLKTDFIKYSERVNAIIKQLTSIAQGTSDKEVFETIFSQAEIFSRFFLSYYLSINKI